MNSSMARSGGRKKGEQNKSAEYILSRASLLRCAKPRKRLTIHSFLFLCQQSASRKAKTTRRLGRVIRTVGIGVILTGNKRKNDDENKNDH